MDSVFRRAMGVAYRVIRNHNATSGSGSIRLATRDSGIDDTPRPGEPIKPVEKGRAMTDENQTETNTEPVGEKCRWCDETTGTIAPHSNLYLAFYEQHESRAHIIAGIRNRLGDSETENVIRTLIDEGIIR